MADEQKTDEQIKAEAEAKAKVEFSPEQQVKVQGVVDAACKRAYAKASQEIARLEAEIAALKAGDGKGNVSEVVKTLTAELDKVKADSAKKSAR